MTLEEAGTDKMDGELVNAGAHSPQTKRNRQLMINDLESVPALKRFLCQTRFPR